MISSSSDSEKSECLLERDGEEILDPAALVLPLPNSSSSSSSSSAEDFLPTSLRSGCGFALVGSVCSRQPPDDRSSRSFEFLHFIRRFWNQIFTCEPEERGEFRKFYVRSRGMRKLRTRCPACEELTCESFRPSLEASFFLSGLLIYFCFWNIFSKALRCTSENTALLSIPLRGFPLAARGHENVPGIGTTDVDATTQTQKKSWNLLTLLLFAENKIDPQRPNCKLESPHCFKNLNLNPLRGFTGI